MRAPTPHRLGEEADLRGRDTVADTDDHHVAHGADDAHRDVERRLQTDEVEDGGRTLTAGDLADIGNGVGVTQHHLVGADLAREGQLLVVHVEHDHP